MKSTWVHLLFVIVLGALTTVSLPDLTWAGDVTTKEDGSTKWQAGVDGVEIEWNADGTVRRVRSKFSTPVEFPDRRGITKAQIIAEEKAKAAIVRFMNQSVASVRIVTEIQTDLNRATQVRQSGQAATIRKTDDRTLVENLTEVTSSFASGTLKGVIVLEKGYDDKVQEAWTTVGFSEKTMRAAMATKSMADRQKHNDSTGQTGNDNSRMGIQPSETRRSKQNDW